MPQELSVSNSSVDVPTTYKEQYPKNSPSGSPVQDTTSLESKSADTSTKQKVASPAPSDSEAAVNDPVPVQEKASPEAQGNIEDQGSKLKALVDKKAPWHKIVPALNLSGRSAELIKHCLFESKSNGIISLTLDNSREGLLAESTKQDIQAALSSFYAEDVTLKLGVSEISTESLEQETPAQRTARNEIERQQNAESNIASDPFVIELQNRFGAQVVPGSVEPK